MFTTASLVEGRSTCPTINRAKCARRCLERRCRMRLCVIGHRRRSRRCRSDRSPLPHDRRRPPAFGASAGRRHSSSHDETRTFPMVDAVTLCTLTTFHAARFETGRPNPRRVLLESTRNVPGSDGHRRGVVVRTSRSAVEKHSKAGLLAQAQPAGVGGAVGGRRVRTVTTGRIWPHQRGTADSELGPTGARPRQVRPCRDADLRRWSGPLRGRREACALAAGWIRTSRTEPKAPDLAICQE